MSRDGLGRAVVTALLERSPAADPDDLGARGTGAGGEGPPPPGTAPAVPVLAALLVLGAVGASCPGLTGSSEVPGEAVEVAAAPGLVVVGALPDPDADPRADVLSVRLAVEGRGSADVTVLGGGSGGPGRRVAGRVALTGSSWLASRAEQPVVVRAGGVTTVVVTVDVGCEPAPALEPWLRVRPPSGAVELVELDVVDGAGARGVLGAACAAREEERQRLGPPPPAP